MPVGLFGKDCWPTRNPVSFLLSIKDNLRAKEIASLIWRRMVNHARGHIGHAIHPGGHGEQEASGRSHEQAEQADTAPAARGFSKARGRAVPHGYRPDVWRQSDHDWQASRRIL
jgi:hypothetical protein